MKSIWAHLLSLLSGRWQLPIVLVVLLATLLPGLGRSGLLDPWEMDRAAVARRMASGPRVLVLEGAHGGLLQTVDRQAPQHYGLIRPSEQGDAGPAATVLLGTAWLNRQLAHAVVIDVDGVLADHSGKVDLLAQQILQIENQNRATALILVGLPAVRPQVQAALGRARAKELGANWHAATGAAILESPEAERALSGVLIGDEPWATPEQLPAVLSQHCPSPWRMPAHKKEGQTATVPWLEAAVIAASFHSLGPSETAARLPSALLAVLTGLLLVLGARRLWGTPQALLTLLVFLTLPMTWGLGRTVSFAAVTPLGWTLAGLGLALGAARASKLWPLWLGLGAVCLLFAQGLSGLVAVSAVALIAAVVLADRALAATTVALLIALGLAALQVYRWAPDDLLWRSLRFTQWSFAAGPDQVHRDFAWFIGQIGFGLYPWGAPLTLGAAWLLGAPGQAPVEPSRQRPGLVLLVALVVVLTVESVLIRSFNHFSAPIGPLAALLTGSLLADVLAGRVGGRLVAVFVGLATLLLHHDLGKEAAAVTRIFAFDPPLQLGTGDLQWPTELQLPKALSALALLSVFGFAASAASPHEPVRQAVDRLRQRRVAGWALGILGILWALDALISLGTKLDVLLKAEANLRNYGHDRIWVTIQGIRPEVLAGATSLLILLLTIALLQIWEDADRRPQWLTRLLGWSRALAAPVPALALIGVAVLGTLLSGLALFAQVRNASWGQALLAGVQSAAFAVPLLLAGALAVVRALLPSAPRTASLLEPLDELARDRFDFAAGLLGLLAVTGIGVGACQGAGTWSYPYLGSIWVLALLATATVIGRADQQAARLAWPSAGLGLWVGSSVFVPMYTRYAQELAEGAGDNTGLSAGQYLGKLLIASPDCAILVLGAAVVVAIRFADARPPWRRWLEAAVGLSATLQRPAVATGLLVAAGIAFTGGYAFSLLPGLSLHFSQKHLLQRIAEAGGAQQDDHGNPRTYSYGSAKTGGDNNFYTQSMPKLEDRQAVLAVLAGENTAARITDNARGGATRTVLLPGWNPLTDSNHDGKRDQDSWFGLVTAVAGTNIQVQGAHLTPHQWQGATAWNASGKSSDIVDNGADSITLAQDLSLTADDPTRGVLVLDKATDAKAHVYAAATPIQRFVVVPKDSFSELNHAFRSAHAGAPVPVLDAASSRLVLASNVLIPGQESQNWLAKSLISQAQFDQTPGVNKIYVNFDNSIELIGYRLADNSVARSQKYKMTLYWRVKKPTSTSWKLFMHPHPLHLDRWPLTQPDTSEDENKPCVGCFQTNHWLAGDIIADSFEQEVPLGTQSGPNEIILGWYTPGSDQRMPVLSASGPGVIKHSDNRATIGQLQIR